MRGPLAAIWGTAGLSLLLGAAVYRLGSRAAGIFWLDLSWLHWGLLILGTAFMAYSEGYRGFQQSFSPRVGARTRYLWFHADNLEALLAPFFLMGYFRTERKRQIVSLLLTVTIVCLVLLVRLLPSPWREIVDFGVAVGLGWGLISLWISIWSALRSQEYGASPEIPGFRVGRTIEYEKTRETASTC